jgi:hypothetical protein
VLLSAAAYVLLEAIRRLGLAGTELARAQVGTIRLKLLKLGAVIVRNCPRRGPAVSAPRCGVALPREAVAPRATAFQHRLPAAGTLRESRPAPQHRLNARARRCPGVQCSMG